jgi:hypothetical protein
MRKTLTALIALVVLGCSGGAPPTQTVQPVRAVPPQPARDASGNILTQPVTIPEGTEFTVQTLDFLSSQTAAQGDPIHLEVQNNVLIDGAIAIAAGSPVKGVINSVTHASRMGKAGNISVRIESGETVDGQRIRLRATKAQSTDDKVGSVVALTVLVSPLFLLKKGNDVAYQPGTVVTVYTDERLGVRAWKR